MYDPKSNVITSEIYEESKIIAEKKIKEELEEIKIEEIVKEEDIDLSIDEFEEDEEEIPLKFEKRKVAKEALEEGEDFAGVECPFCGELYDDLASHIQNCELAPDDASLDDILPSKPKKKRKNVAAAERDSKKKKFRESLLSSLRTDGGTRLHELYEIGYGIFGRDPAKFNPSIRGEINKLIREKKIAYRDSLYWISETRTSSTIQKRRVRRPRRQVR